MAITQRTHRARVRSPRSIPAILVLFSLACSGPEIGKGQGEFFVDDNGSTHYLVPARESLAVSDSARAYRWVLSAPAIEGRLELAGPRRLVAGDSFDLLAHDGPAAPVSLFWWPSGQVGTASADSGFIAMHLSPIGDIVDFDVWVSPKDSGAARSVRLRGSLYKLSRTPSWLLKSPG